MEVLYPLCLRQPFLTCGDDDYHIRRGITVVVLVAYITHIVRYGEVG